MLMAKKDSISYELAYFTMWAVWKDFTLGRRPATNLIELVQGLIAIYAFDDGTSTFTCKAYDYAFMLLYSALTLAAAGMLKGSNGSLSPSIQDPSSTKAQQMVSSSNNLHLQPLKLSIFIFLVLV
ncbi:hypothetical protein CUMW_248170 [Citrus unshiu]|uniref:Uncharacterized protein n=1 Tax=Citrus unshiu TaxID=55188 RepID=A0A2H5QP14_CITUN|nr:hypothetical protein CUMW_248170 [Citrus unshiu]